MVNRDIQESKAFKENQEYQDEKVEKEDWVKQD